MLAGALVVAGCTKPGETRGNTSSTPQHGGQLIVLDDSSFSGSWPSGLDPATNTTGGGNLTQMSAVYGGLFRLVAADDGSNAKVEPYQADSYTFADGAKTVRIKIKPGIKFTDGTPFDAAAVAFNIKRDMQATCTCKPMWQLADQNPITTEGSDTVVLKFKNPNASAINSFVVSNVNWIASPAAVQQMGDNFRIKPVGAGPFKVVSDQLSSELVLERNPNYFVPDRPYLDRLIVRSIGGDQPAYQALLAGQGQVYEGMTTIPLLEQAKSNSQLVVTQQPATSPYVIQLNTKIPPFNDIRAREAIYYATDVEAIRKGLFKDAYPASQTFTAPGGLFYHATIPGYRTYDLDKAKAIVQQLGGLTVDLGTLSAYVADQVDTALQTQWQAAGIKVKIHSDQLNGLVQNFTGGKWQAMLQTAGAWDPAVGVGVGFRFGTTSPFSGISDKTIDDLLQQATQTTDAATRDALYLQVGQRISDQAYAPFILAFAPASVVTKNVYGPGLTTLIPPVVVNTGILWADVWMSQT
ncbi:MAG TPA: ABC transporter substrate-binding protein [Rugosimonospora sp.]|nr:ABC transporter substrate-binding protein [Rugosimonospora sp.]